MATKSTTTEAKSSSKDVPPDLSSTVRESAQQIWLAGLGAFSKAQEEGGKMFDALVKEGATLQSKTHSTAGEKLSEATSKMATMATELSSRASGQWDKLETIFEGRVSKALSKLGVPTAKDIEALNARIDALSRQLSEAGVGPAAAKPAPQKGPPPAAAKRQPDPKTR